MRKRTGSLPSTSARHKARQSAPNEVPVSKPTKVPALKSATEHASRHLPARKKTTPANQVKQGIVGVRDNNLEVAIGLEVRAIRAKLGMTASDLARAAHLSLGMLSKIENGLTSASLTTLQRLAMALGVQVTALFRRFDETREAIYVRSGRGFIERYPRRAGQQRQPLGYPDGFAGSAEPHLITLTEKSQKYPIVRHSGYEFIYMLEGEVLYRHSDKIYRMRPGDSLFFNAAAEHGPEELVKLPIRLLSVIGTAHDALRA